MRTTPTPNIDQRYIDLSHHIRQLEVQELKTGKYPHLRNPNRKIKLPPIRKHVFDAERFRPKYLFRPGLPLHQGHRSLNIGRIEIILEYFGTPKDNWMDGFEVNEDRSLRVICGGYIDTDIMKKIAKYQNNPLVKRQLATGNYQRFVETTLWETNNILDLAKQYYRAHPGCTKFK